MKAHSTVSTKQWKRFRQHTIFWQVLLGLQDWNVSCVLADEAMCDQAGCSIRSEEPTFAMAWVCCDSENRIATVYLRQDWVPAEISEDELDMAAFHEMCHVLLTPLENYANVGVSAQITSIETHRIIRVLENTFYDNYKPNLPG